MDWRSAVKEGIYPVSFAAKMTEMTNARVASWFRARSKSTLAPAILTPYDPIQGQIVMPFLALVESRFVARFRKHGLSLQTIRKVALKLRQQHDLLHPFATETRFRTDGRRIMLQIADDEEKRLLDIMTDEWAFPSVLEPSLFDSVVYVDDLAVRLKPFPEFPNVIIDPQYALGRPVIDEGFVPTRTLAAAYLAEGDLDAVADWFDTSPVLVSQAVGFEQRIAA
ncbi:hypothetical protein O9X98_15915 [Agrobacterium salinitolerans]|nr:hypothetical protein [Agrobacterium salinitolerans]